MSEAAPLSFAARGWPLVALLCVTQVLNMLDNATFPALIPVFQPLWNLSGTEAIPGTVGVPLPNLLSRPAMIANFLMRHAGQSAEEKIAQRAAEQYLNPATLAQGLQPIPPRYAPLIDALTRQAVGAAGATAGRNY